MNLKKMQYVSAIGLAGAMTASGVAQAFPISDYLIVRNRTGAQVAYTSITEEDEAALPNGPLRIPFLNLSSLLPGLNPANGGVDPLQFGNFINFTDPDDPLFVSDIVGVVSCDPALVACGPGVDFVLGFNSDSEILPAVFAGPGQVLPEQPREIDVSGFLDPALRAAGFTAAFLSNDIPEPTSLALLGTGLIGVAARARKRNRNTVS